MATITKRRWKTGKGEEREAWVLAFNDASGKRHKEQFAKKRDAEARRTAVSHQVVSGTFRADASSTTVEEVCRAYLKHLATRKDRGERVTEHYYRTVEGQLLNYVAPQEGRAVRFDGGIGSMKLAHCTAKAVSDFRDRLREAGVGVATTRRILGSLSGALQHAVAGDLMANNPALSIRVTGKRNEGSKKVTPPGKRDLSLALALATGSLGVRMRLSASSGIRASELYALQWGHVSFNGGELTVDGRVDAYGNVDTTKSTAGLHRVPLSSSMLEELRSWREKAKRKEAGDLVFPNARGSHLSHHNVLSREFRPLMKLAAQKAKEREESFEPFNWHALRHFAISTWIEAGMQPKTVQTFAGHSSLAVTMTRYGHMFPSDSHRNVMDQIATSIFGNGA